MQRWQWLVHKNGNADVARTPVPKVPPKGKIEIRAALTPLHRGYIYLEGFTFLKMEPLGFMRSFYHATRKERLLVLPKRYKVPPLDLPGKRRHHTGGVALTSKVGDSEEFISLREYRPGDPMRKIHWKSLAKTGRLIIRENQDEHFVRHALILDTHVPQGATGRGFEAAVSLAASYASKLDTGESLLDLFFAGSRVYHYAAGRGLSGNKKFLEILALVQPAAVPSFLEVSRTVLRYTGLLSSAVLIFNTLDDERLDLLSRLKASGIAVTAFLIGEDHAEPPKGLVHHLEHNNMQSGLNRLRRHP